MATIACIAWGSLVYDPGELPLSAEWYEDGPRLPVEFCRESQSAVITLVITPNVPLVTTLWTTLEVRDLLHARQLLANREARRGSAPLRIVGFWSRLEAGGPLREVIGAWAAPLNVDGVVWTALPPKFRGVERVPTIAEVIAHLRSLRGEVRQRAERYVRLTPKQIRTDYRAAIEENLAWTPIGPPARRCTDRDLT